MDMFIKSWQKLGHWNKGIKLVFDIDLIFLKNILMKVDKIVYFYIVHPMSLFSIFNTYVNDIFELL